MLEIEREQESRPIGPEGKNGVDNLSSVVKNSVSMRSGELIGKRVIGGQAQILGRIEEVEFDTTTWKITAIIMKLERTLVEDMGFEKPRIMGNVKVSLPIEVVNAVSDFVSLKRSAIELKEMARKV